MSTALEAPEISDFDPYSAAFRNNPESFRSRLLRESPGFIMAEGTPSAYVARYEQVSSILMDAKRFSSVKPSGLPGMQKFDFFNGQPVMNYTDPPQHDRLRRVVNAAFLPPRVAKLADLIQRNIDQTLDSLSPSNEFEAINDLARPIAINLLLGHFMGLAPEDYPIFLNLSKTLPLLDLVPTGGAKPQPYLEAWAAGEAYCREATARARREKRDDLVSLIVDAHDEGGVLSDSEMFAMMMVLFLGGVPTVSGGAGSSLLKLVQHPSQIARVASDAGAAASHFEESLRLDPIVTLVMRFATEDVKIGGSVIQAGTPVYVLNSVAGFDPATFPEPEQFDPDRKNVRRHLAFGQGIHMCIGQNVARATVPLILKAICTRFPKLRLADKTDPFRYDTIVRSRHLAELHLAA